MAVKSTTTKMINTIISISKKLSAITSIANTTATSKTIMSITKTRDTKSAEMAVAAIPISLTLITIARKSVSTVMMSAKTSATIASTMTTALIGNSINSTITNSENKKCQTKKSAFIIGDSMIKKTDGYLLMSSVNHSYIVKVLPFLSAKTVDMFDYIKPTQRDFNPDVYILHVGTKRSIVQQITGINIFRYFKFSQISEIKQ